jgi:hypothetical protein
MRWKISHHGHDPRQIDLLAIVVLLIVILGATFYFSDHTAPPNNTTLIEPSQHVRW